MTEMNPEMPVHMTTDPEAPGEFEGTPMPDQITAPLREAAQLLPAASTFTDPVSGTQYEVVRANDGSLYKRRIEVVRGNDGLLYKKPVLAVPTPPPAPTTTVRYSINHETGRTQVNIDAPDPKWAHFHTLQAQNALGAHFYDKGEGEGEGDDDDDEQRDRETADIIPFTDNPSRKPSRRDRSEHYQDEEDYSVSLDKQQVDHKTVLLSAIKNRRGDFVRMARSRQVVWVLAFLAIADVGGVAASNTVGAFHSLGKNPFKWIDKAEQYNYHMNWDPLAGIGI